MALKSTALKSTALKLPVLYKQLAVLSALALGTTFFSFARADCTLDSPIFVSAFGYDYLNPLEQAVQFPFRCDTDTPVSYTVRSSGGTLEAVTNNWLGNMASGTEKLNYFIIKSIGTVVSPANVRTILNFQMVVPALQWNAPSLIYGDTLIINLTF
jgi:hypothetical protein